MILPDPFEPYVPSCNRLPCSMEVIPTDSSCFVSHFKAIGVHLQQNNLFLNSHCVYILNSILLKDKHFYDLSGEKWLLEKNQDRNTITDLGFKSTLYP